MMSVNLFSLTKEFDLFFEIGELSEDPSMKIFLPKVYKDYKLPVKQIFEPKFRKHFNGLMVVGDNLVQTVFAASFPHREILKKFINLSQPGDLLFVHHPIPMECGDPKGNLGKGFIPLDPKLLQQIINKRLSIYSCHAPLDYHRLISTNRSIAQTLSAVIESEFLPYGNGYAGLIGTIQPVSTESLIKKLKSIFSIPYVDFAGKKLDSITKIGIVAGGGDEVEYSRKCSIKGCQAYITGEIFSRQISKWAKNNFRKIQSYAKSSNLSLIGVSHSASEYLVMKTQLKDWVESKFNIQLIPIKQKKWWL
jgi:putative NIF3 family GTP cyclohydrolase 1 type 2